MISRRRLSFSLFLTFFLEISTETYEISAPNVQPPKCIVPFSDIMDEYCHGKLDALIETMHNFTECIMRSSLSLAACSSCAVHFQSYNESKLELETDQRKDENNQTCAQLLHVAKKSLVDYEEASPFGLWKNGSCDLCYLLDEDEDRRTKRKLHPDYVKFQTYFREYKDCTCEFLSDDDSADLCGNCSLAYRRLLDFFHESLVKRNGKQLERSFLDCLDVKQKLNATTYEWSRIFGCGKHFKTDEFATFVLSGFFLVLPIAFYFGVWVGSDDSPENYEVVRHTSLFEEDDDDDDDDVFVDRVGGGEDERLVAASACPPSSLSTALFLTCREDEGFETRVDRSSMRLGNSTVASVGTGSVASGSPRFRQYSPVSSTNNLLI